MENNQIQGITKFADKKQDILKELEKRLADSGISEDVTLIDGFVNQPVYMELTDSLVLGGPTIPMIMLLGKKSGRIYLFALKAILKL